MLSISKTTVGFYCIEWSATEEGPKIIKSDFIKTNQNINDKNVLKNIIQSFKPILKKESKSLAITLEENNFLLSEFKLDDNVGSEYFVNWYENNILNKNFKNDYDLYYYPLKNKNLLTVSVNKKLKNKLIKQCSDIGYNLIYFSIGIFSASTLIRQMYKKEDFLVWKIDKNNYHHLLYYKDNILQTYCKMKKSPKKINEIMLIGENNNNLNNLLHSILIDKKYFDKVANIYLYQTGNSSKLIKEIESYDFKNINIVDISILFDSDKIKSKLKSMKYIENGISFRGIDV